jgi:MFS superfamily sulfate permease-like transporter
MVIPGAPHLLIAGQLGPATGVPVTGEAFAAQIASFTRHVGDTRLATAAITVAVLAFLLLLRARWPRAPGPLLAVLLAAAAVAGLGLQRDGVQVAGTVPAGLPAPAIPSLQPARFGQLALPAFSVFIVAFSDDVLLRVSQMADELPQIAELDLSPVVARPDGVRAIDARVRVQPAEPSDAYLRRL